MSSLGNWIRATTSTTGTGAVTPAAATGWISPLAYFAIGERFRYVLEADDTGLPVEAGIGYHNGTTMTRERVQAAIVAGGYSEASSNSGLSAVSLSGTTRIICAPLHVDIAQIPVAGISSGTQANDIFCPFNFESPSTGTLTLSSGGRSFYIPVLLCWQHVVDAFCIRPSGTVGNTDLGLYDVLPSGMPGDLLIGWQNQSVTASAVNAYSFSGRTHGRWGAAPRILPPGWYWAYFNCASAMTFGRTFSLNQRSMIPSASLDTGTRQTCLVKNNAQGTLPQPGDASGLSLGTVGGSTDIVTVPAFGFRRAA
jgi:hypothetical protein